MTTEVFEKIIADLDERMYRECRCKAKAKQKLMERLNYLFWEGNYPGQRIDLAIEAIRDAGISDEHETTLVLKDSLWRSLDPDDTKPIGGGK